MDIDIAAGNPEAKMKCRTPPDNNKMIKKEKTACTLENAMIEYRSCVMKNPGYMPVLIYKNICKEVKKMRNGIHPDYYQAKVVCNCGNEFVTGSTKEEIHVEICSKCHSFYTGQQKAIKARGRIDMFNKKYGVSAN